MMERYCISLELAKKLLELGFNRECYFRWKNYYGDGESWYLTESMVHDNEGAIPAYSVGELGDILTVWTTRCMEYDDTTWNVFYRLELIGKYPTEAEARGYLLKFLLENNLL